MSFGLVLLADLLDCHGGERLLYVVVGCGRCRGAALSTTRQGEVLAQETRKGYRARLVGLRSAPLDLRAIHRNAIPAADGEYKKSPH